MGRETRLEADSLDFYLDDLANVPTLSREAEVELALKVEAANEAARAALLESRIAPRLVLDLLGRLADGELTAAELTGTPGVEQFDEKATRERLLAAAQRLGELVSADCECKTEMDCACVQARAFVATLPLNRASVSELLEQLRTAAEHGTEHGWGSGPTAGEAWRDARRHLATATRAKSKLAEANLRLVVSLARRYARRGLPIGDLIQEGNLGLLKAIDGYDPHRGFRLSTYASWWIRQSMQHALAEQTRTIRIPRHMTEAASAVDRFARGFRAEHKRAPSPEEIAESLGLPLARVEAALDLAPDAISLETPLGSDDDALELGDTVADASGPSPAEVLLVRDFSSRTHEALETLSPDERAVLTLRFGLDEDGITHAIDEVAATLAMTAERVRQTESRALRKLRHAKRTRALRSYARD